MYAATEGPNCSMLTASAGASSDRYMSTLASHDPSQFVGQIAIDQEFMHAELDGFDNDLGFVLADGGDHQTSGVSGTGGGWDLSQLT